MRFTWTLVLTAVWLYSYEALADTRIDYGRDVQPILAANCLHCHGQDESTREAGLRLDEREAATADLGGYAAIVPGSADTSTIIARITETDESLRMPPPDSGHRVDQDEIAILRAWIDQGAEYQPHWAFTRLPQAVAGGSIDKFIRTRLHAIGLELNPEADRRTLVRRLSLDLRGLPPTPSEVDEFLADTRSDAYERLVDRMLASPHTAERLAIDWLDSARYADTNGFSIDDGRSMWAWRDWVIKAFADNMPYDEFATAQIAGDLLPEAEQADQLATGFLRCSMNTHEGGTLPEEYRVISMADKVDTVATAFLGLTMRCAQCHDHKYDPISQQDYYRFYALFNTTSEPGHGATNTNTAPTMLVEPPLPTTWRKAIAHRLSDLDRALQAPDPELSDAREAWEADLRGRAAELVSTGQQEFDAAIGVALQVPPSERCKDEWRIINEAFATVSPAMRDLLNNVGVEKKILTDQLAEVRVSVMVMDHQPGRVTHRLERGQYDQPREQVEPGVPAAFGPWRHVRNRLELAQWLTDPAHPLTPRVAVNRYWQMIFGRGLVATSEDFGVRADPPSHPELLDWLAADFIAHGWDVRRLLKLIATSATYKQSAIASKKALKVDPENRLLSRSTCRRLAAEFVRDNALSVAGLLDTEVGGPPIFSPQPDGLWREVSHYGHPTEFFTAQAYYPTHGPHRYRRSLYIYWKRSSPPPVLSAFDAPTRETCVVRRGETTTPLQALVLWNEPQFLHAARGLASRSMGVARTDANILEKMFVLALGRSPSDLEQGRLLAQVERHRQHYADRKPAAQAVAGAEGTGGAVEQAAWTLVASTIINLHEFNSRP